MSSAVIGPSHGAADRQEQARNRRCHAALPASACHTACDRARTWRYILPMTLALRSPENSKCCFPMAAPRPLICLPAGPCRPSKIFLPGALSFLLLFEERTKIRVGKSRSLCRPVLPRTLCLLGSAGQERRFLSVLRPPFSAGPFFLQSEGYHI